MAESKVVKNRAFRNERVDVDGIEFQDCTFDNCELVYSGGEPFFLGGPGSQNVIISFEGAAANTLNVLRVMHRFGMHEGVENIIHSIRNPFDDPVH